VFVAADALPRTAASERRNTAERLHQQQRDHHEVVTSAPHSQIERAQKLPIAATGLKFI